MTPHDIKIAVWTIFGVISLLDMLIVIALFKISGHLADISEDIENISDLKIEEKIVDN